MNFARSTRPRSTWGRRARLHGSTGAGSNASTARSCLYRPFRNSSRSATWQTRSWTVPDHLLPDLKSVRKKRGDYDVAELGRVSNRRAIVGGIVEHWSATRTVCGRSPSGVTKAHARHITRAFQAAGVPWGYVDGKTAYDERQRLLNRVTDGDLIGLSCADLLTAGVDRPAIKCVIQARPTLSLVVHLQQTGRCMRPWGGVAPVILDHAGNSRRLGLPQEERDWQAIFESETGSSSVQSSGSRQRVKVCDRCFGVMPPHVAACRL